MSKKIFITGISTDVGKTLVSAILVEALQADYWKPIQAGDLNNSDTDRVKFLVSNQKSKFYNNAYGLNTAMSPHAAAEIDDVQIDLKNIKIPKADNTLIIEGAGGILVPINNHQTILDIIPKQAKVIVVSRHYLGSINHTLMTLALLKQKGFEPMLIFSGDEHVSTEKIIKKMSGVTVIGRIDEEVAIDKPMIKKYADRFKNVLELILK